MAVLVLGLLVSSAKGAYDTERNEVIQMAAYGPEAEDVRARLRDSVEEGIQQMWPRTMRRSAHFTPNIGAGNLMYGAIQRLPAQRHPGRPQDAGNDSRCGPC